MHFVNLSNKKLKCCEFRHYFLCCVASKSWLSRNKPKFEQKTMLCVFFLYYECLLHVRYCEEQAKHMQIAEEFLCKIDFPNEIRHAMITSQALEQKTTARHGREDLLAKPWHCSDTQCNPGELNCARFSSGVGWGVSSLQSPPLQSSCLCEGAGNALLLGSVQKLA